MKNNKKALLLGMVAILIVLALIAVFASKGAKTTKSGSAAQETTSIDSAQTEAEKADDDKKAEEKADESDSTQERVLDPEIDGNGEPDPGLSGFKPNYQGLDTENKKKDKKKSEEEAAKITFPYEIPEQGIIVEKLTSYSDAYIEDGSGDSVKKVAALVINNDGDAPIEYVQITIVQDGEERVFTGSDIERGSKCIMLEKDRKKYDDSACTAVDADVAWSDGLEMSESEVTIRETEKGALNISNISGEKIPCIRIFYKFYMDDEDAYVGGITFNAKVTNLKSGEDITITPSHYVAGYSKVVEVRTYSSDN